MRRAVTLLVSCAALTGAVSAAARPVPVEYHGPRVRVDMLPARTGESTRVRVIARLGLEPLAARGLASRTARTGILAQQASAARQIRAAIPEARIGRRFQVVLNALTVSLPAAKLPALLRQSAVAKVYPSLTYTLATNRSPSIIGADVLRRATNADGSGIKIGVIDDGIDQSNAFFAPAAFSYPPGFPRGGRKWTTPKVIVARVFPGPNAGKAGRLAVDPASSYHGTHVAGIAAGISGTTAPAGQDHPRVTGLSGVAPRAWLGNYRVFTVPSPDGQHVANTPEVIAALEAAVKDGMDVVNFSGGGPQIDPANDALTQAIQDVTDAGVVAVIAAGNDRDEFGLGSAGSPGTAQSAISVAAVSNAHVFTPSLDVTAAGAPATLHGIPFVGLNDARPPSEWSSNDQTLVDVGSIVGTDGKPVARNLCDRTLPSESLTGAIALVDRGICPLDEKAGRAKLAGAAGIVFADNREGEANVLPVDLSIPGGTVSNLDAAGLRAYADAHAGRTTIRVSNDRRELETGRSGVITSFSSAGPTPFGHDLKPDLAAPGGQILSSTLPHVDPSGFAVFDGTSMATPHVAGAAALLLQLHRAWSPAQVKSALVSTATAAWEDTARTREAPVTLGGAGLVSLPRAADPVLFTEPSSLSFEDLDVRRIAASRGLLVRLTDASGGGGTWQVQLVAQAATAGTSVDVPGVVVVPPGGAASLPVVATAAARAAPGENYGFVVLRRGDTTRRIPYLFVVSRPALAAAPAIPLRRTQKGDTRTGASRVERYRYPVAPFGNNPDEPPMVQDGAEKVYVTSLDRPAVNIGVSVLERSSGSRIDPWYLGRKDENTVQGFAGTPVDVNNYTYDYLQPVGAAGASFPRQGSYYVSVDSGRERFTGRRAAGSYTLRSWVDDVTPPSLRLVTTRVSTGWPTLVFRATDTQSGVDPQSLAVGYKGALVAPSKYDRATGLAFFPLPTSVPKLRRGTMRAKMVASDFQEAKNVDVVGTKLMPNTRTATAALRVVAGPTVDWLLPAPKACIGSPQKLVVAAGSPAEMRAVRFDVDGALAATVRSDDQGVWSARVRLRRGTHSITATAIDAKGRTASQTRSVRVCRA